MTLGTVPDGPIWPNMAQMDLYMAQYGLNGTNMALIDPIWPYLVGRAWCTTPPCTTPPCHAEGADVPHLVYLGQGT